ncbi:Protein CBR-MTL-2 [Caenorhabditis briggsae]|uniref:Protein CBR-MTL-2 n=1 Tax=Caenorhabditis briggsae TaxID=6238 RepID=A8WYG2_CAEBR|nr:Protein CBR-MTL-2 [Caenorhabditis briggsae]CAP25420.2 Protein CBR-MTL-2 [Caenorhabditis briggsae]
MVCKCEDRHSAWGSDIDETFCGPGKICGDDWTPLNSLTPTPESQRRRFREPRTQDDVEGIITEQPGFFENHSIDDEIATIATNFDVMTVHEENFQEIPPILVAPVRPRSRRKKKKKLRRKPVVKGRRRRNIKSGRSQLSKTATQTPILQSRFFCVSKTLNFFSENHGRPRRHLIYVRRIRFHQDPRYPAIPRPQKNVDLKFRRSHPEDVKNRFSKVIPPRHLKGYPISARPHFRYRGIPKVIG